MRESAVGDSSPRWIVQTAGFRSQIASSCVGRSGAYGGGTRSGTGRPRSSSSGRIAATAARCTSAGGSAGTGAVKRFRLKGRGVRARAAAASTRMASDAV